MQMANYADQYGFLPRNNEFEFTGDLAPLNVFNKYFAGENRPGLAAFNKDVENLQPGLETYLDKCSIETLRNVYSLLSFVCRKYTIENGCVQFLEIEDLWIYSSKKLGFKEVALTHASVNLFNYTTGEKWLLGGPEDIKILRTFTGASDEEWFYSIMNIIEYQGYFILLRMIDLNLFINRNHESLVLRVLLACRTVLHNMAKYFNKIYDKCGPEFFHNKIKPYFGSNCIAAQSSLLYSFDVVLGVKHMYDVNFYEQQLNYMPAADRCTVLELANAFKYDKLRNYVNKHSALITPYDGAIDALSEFRNLLYKFSKSSAAVDQKLLLYCAKIDTNIEKIDKISCLELFLIIFL